MATSTARKGSVNTVATQKKSAKARAKAGPVKEAKEQGAYRSLSANDLFVSTCRPYMIKGCVSQR